MSLVSPPSSNGWTIPLKQQPKFFIVITPDCSQKVPAKKFVARVIEIHNLDHAAKKEQVLILFLKESA
jgi:hypothetical protein